MKRLTIVVVMAALAYSGFWFGNALTQKSAINGWFEDRRLAGWTAEFTDLEVKGFPNRLDTTISSPRIGAPNSGPLWESPFFQIFRLTYNPSHLIMVAANEQTLSTRDTEIGVTTTDLRASLEMADLTTWTPERLILVAEGLEMSATSGWALNADVAQLSTEIAEGNNYRVGLAARNLTGSLAGIANASTNQTPIDRLLLDANLSFSGPINHHSLEQRRPQLEILALNLAEAEWNGFKLAAAGMLEVSPSGTLNGQIILKLRNWRDIVEKERSQNRLSQNALNQIELTLSLISGLSGNPETLDLPFDFKNGQIWLGPLNLGKAPNLLIP